jgi:tRNA dimethylallyltransferase
MFYLSALVNGLSELPGADESMRAEILDFANRHGWQALHEGLRQIDPSLAARIGPGDRQRLQRAHEIHRVTGRAPSDVMYESRREAMPFRRMFIAMFHPRRESLHGRIARRFENMIEQGFIEEVEELRSDSRLDADSVAIRTVGYRQCWEYLEGRCDIDTFKDRAVAATRQLAKRQLTWLRGTPGMVWIDASHPEANTTLLRYVENSRKLVLRTINNRVTNL